MSKTYTIDYASVKVMRSHDYCHFEVCLSASEFENITEIDDLRKEAARLADKAVEQYKTAKQAHATKDNISQQFDYEQAIKTPVEDRSWHDKAVIKYHEDAAFRERFDYDYQDDWNQPGFED